VVWSRERAYVHLDYIQKLWNAVRKADAEGKSLNEIYTQLSADNDFAFIKQMPLYGDRGDEWVLPQHNMHIRAFFLQGKTVASVIIENALPDSLPTALAKIRKLNNESADIYIEEAAINAIGYNLLNSEQLANAVKVFELNIELFPESFNVYDSYAEALMKSGDTQNAILNYRKSIELNPENENAREMLETLKDKI
jgi:tetratricopeptide (TPR) repeat protein